MTVSADRYAMLGGVVTAYGYNTASAAGVAPLGDVCAYITAWARLAVTPLL